MSLSPLGVSLAGSWGREGPLVGVVPGAAKGPVSQACARLGAARRGLPKVSSRPIHSCTPSTQDLRSR